MRTAGQSLCILTATALFACAGGEAPVADSTGALECLDLALDSADNIENVLDELHVLPGRQFIVRLDSADVSTWGLTGNRLGVPSSLPNVELLTAGVWHAPSSDTVFLTWWSGLDGVRLELVRSGRGFSGRGIQQDDFGCPGSEYCYEGRVSATPIGCPVTDWLQADSSGWIPWRE